MPNVEAFMGLAQLGLELRRRKRTSTRSDRGWFFSPSGGVYFLAVFLILPGTAFAFGRLLFEFLRRRAV